MSAGILFRTIRNGKHCHKKPNYFNCKVLLHQNCYSTQQIISTSAYMYIYSNYLFKLSNFGASFPLITVRHKPIRLQHTSRGIYWNARYELVLLIQYEISQKKNVNVLRTLQYFDSSRMKWIINHGLIHIKIDL